MSDRLVTSDALSRHVTFTPKKTASEKRDFAATVLFLVPALFALSAWHAYQLSFEGFSGNDIALYAGHYFDVTYCGCLRYMEPGSSEYLWAYLMLAFSKLGFSFATFQFVVVLAQKFLWLTFALISVRSIGGSRGITALALVPVVLLLMQVYPFLISGQSNILRAGLAVPVSSLAVLAWWHHRRVLAVVLLVCTAGLHEQLIWIALSGFLFFLLIRKAIAGFAFWSLAIAYLLGLSTLIARFVVPPSLLRAGLEYGAGSGYDVGIRWDFALLTVVLYALIALLTSQQGFEGRLSSWMTGLSVPFLLVGGAAAYADRWISPMWSVSAVLLVVLGFHRMPDRAKAPVALLSLFASVGLLLLAQPQPPI